VAFEEILRLGFRTKAAGNPVSYGRDEPLTLETPSPSKKDENPGPCNPPREDH